MVRMTGQLDTVHKNAVPGPCSTHLHNCQHVVGLRLYKLVVLGLGRNVLDKRAGPDAIGSAVTVIKNTCIWAISINLQGGEPML